MFKTSRFLNKKRKFGSTENNNNNNTSYNNKKKRRTNNNNNNTCFKFKPSTILGYAIDENTHYHPESPKLLTKIQPNFTSITSPTYKEPYLYEPTEEDLDSSPYRFNLNDDGTCKIGPPSPPPLFLSPKLPSPSPSNLSDFNLSLDINENKIEIEIENENEKVIPPIYIDLRSLFVSKFDVDTIPMLCLDMEYEEECVWREKCRYGQFHQEIIQSKSWYEFNQICRKFTGNLTSYGVVLNLYYKKHHPTSTEYELIEFLLYIDLLVNKQCEKEGKKPPTTSICPWYLLYRLRELSDYDNRMYVPVVQKSVNNFKSKFNMIMRYLYNEEKKYFSEKIACPNFKLFKINETLLNSQITEQNNKVQDIMKKNIKRNLFLGTNKELSHQDFELEDIQKLEDEYKHIKIVDSCKDFYLEDNPYASPKECADKGHKLVKCIEAGLILCVYCGYEEYFLIPHNNVCTMFKTETEKLHSKKIRYIYNDLLPWEECMYDERAHEIWKLCEDKKDISKMVRSIDKYCLKQGIMNEWKLYLKLAFPVAYFHVKWSVNDFDLLWTYGKFSNEFPGHNGKIEFVFYKLCELDDKYNGTTTAEKAPLQICDKTYYEKNNDWKSFCRKENLFFIS